MLISGEGTDHPLSGRQVNGLDAELLLDVYSWSQRGNPPTGTLAYNFHKPYAGLIVDLYWGLSWRAQGNYYAYNEKEQLGLVDPTGPRDFRGNMVTLAVRYAF